MPKVEAFELPFVHRNALSTTLGPDYQDKHLYKMSSKIINTLLHAHDRAFFMTKGPIAMDLKGTN